MAPCTGQPVFIFTVLSLSGTDNGVSTRAGEPANFFPVPAPAPDFFFKRLRLLIFFSVTRVQFPYAFYLLAGLRSRLILPAPAPDFFFQASPAPAPRFFSSGSGSGSKEPKTPGSGSPDLVSTPLFKARMWSQSRKEPGALASYEPAPAKIKIYTYQEICHVNGSQNTNLLVILLFLLKKCYLCIWNLYSYLRNFGEKNIFSQIWARARTEAAVGAVALQIHVGSRPVIKFGCLALFWLCSIWGLWGTPQLNIKCLFYSRCYCPRHSR